MFNWFRTGRYIYIPTPAHSCRLPGGFPITGSIWECKCGKRYRCRGLSPWADIIEWTEIDLETTRMQASEDDGQA